MLNLHPDEKVIIYIRRHWIFLFIQTKLIFLLFITPTLLVWALQYFGYVPEFNIFGVSFYSLTDVFIYMWAIFCWLLLAEKFTDYALDFWVLTNKRIIESELLKLFDRRLSTLELQDIEDVTVRVKGVVQTAIGYGTLEVQTAGSEREFLAENIADPAKVQELIFDAKLKQAQEEKDIEKQEFEQIANRVTTERIAVDHNAENHIPLDQKQKEDVKSMAENAFDWAHVNQSQFKDTRNVEEYMETVEDKYKKNTEAALRTGL